MPTIDMYATGQNIKSMVKKQKITVNKMQEAFGFNTPQAIYKCTGVMRCQQLIISSSWQQS